jgi:hypothetical protein
MTTDEARPPLWRHPILVSALAGFGLLFAAGIATGVVAGSLERGAMKPLAAAVMLGALALVAGCGWLLWRTLPGLYAETSPRVTRSRRLLTVSAAVGGALGLLLTLGALATGQEPPDVFSNAPIAGWIALATIGVWLLVVPAGIYAYCAIAPTWWFGWRGGFLPEPQEMVTFLIVVVVWGLVWLTRRYA